MKAAVYNTSNGAIEIKQVDDPVVTETEAITVVGAWVLRDCERSCQYNFQLHYNKVFLGPVSWTFLSTNFPFCFSDLFTSLHLTHVLLLINLVNEN